MLSFFPRDVLDEIWDLTEPVSEGFPTYSSVKAVQMSTSNIIMFLIRDKDGWMTCNFMSFSTVF